MQSSLYEQLLKGVDKNHTKPFIKIKMVTKLVSFVLCTKKSKQKIFTFGITFKIISIR